MGWIRYMLSGLSLLVRRMRRGWSWREENRKMVDRRGGDWGKRLRDGFGGWWEGCLMI